jgi:AraC family L-rhamnose operon regulatory protein RhaS
LQDHSAKDIEHFMKLSSPAPIYRTGADAYGIDDCEAQIAAQGAGKIELYALSKGHYPGIRMNSKVLPGLNSVGFWNCRRDQDWGLQPHRNEGIELVYLETGSIGFEVDGERHGLHAGHLTITRPWQLHRLGDPFIGRGRLSWIILDVGVRRPNQEWAWPDWLVLSRKDLASMTRTLRLGDKAVWTSTPEIREVFRELSRCVVAYGSGCTESRLAVAVNRLLVGVVELVEAQQCEELPGLATRRHTVELFLRDLAENPASCSEVWTLQDMAEHCGMGVTSLSKYARELVNNGPVAYLGLCRLEHAARELLANRRVSVTAVAMAAGFNSSQYFATAFQRRFGVAPGEYRRQGGLERIYRQDAKNAKKRKYFE